MKYVDTPPILAILLWKQKTPPPTFECNSKIQKLVDFHIHSPKIGENGLHPLPPKKIYTPPLDIFDIFPK